jgi:hypothetical protein
MDYKKKIIWGIVMSVLGFFTSVVLAKPELFSLCEKGDKKCIYFFIDYFDNVAQFVGLFSVIFLLLFFIFLFIKEDIFNIWKKFAKIFLPIAVLLVIVTPTHYGGLVGIDKELVTWWSASLFLISSIGIIMWKSIQLRKNK